MQYKDTSSIVIMCMGQSDLYVTSKNMVKWGIELYVVQEATIRSTYARCFRPLPHDHSSLHSRLIETLRLMVEYRRFTLRTDYPHIRGHEYLADEVVRRVHDFDPRLAFPTKVLNNPDFLEWMTYTSFHHSMPRKHDLNLFMILYGARFRHGDGGLIYSQSLGERLQIYLCIYANCPSEAFAYLTRSWYLYWESMDWEWTYRVLIRAKPRPSTAIMAVRYDSLNDYRNAVSLYWRLRIYLTCVEDHPKYASRLDRLVAGRHRPMLSEIYLRAKMNLGLDSKYWWNVAARYDESWGYYKVNRIGLPI